MANTYGCSFVAKLSWKKNQEKIFGFFTKYTLIAEKMFLYGKKVFTEKNRNENVKNIYLIWEICFYTENVCVPN